LIQAYFFCSLYHFCVTHPSLPGKTTLTPTLRIRKNTQKTTLFFEHGRLCADQRQSSNRPFFLDPARPGEGFPFDYFQNTA